MRILAFLIGLLCSAPGWAATGSAAADVFFARPKAECPINGDGMAYGCAGAVGASGAWSTLAAVSHSTTQGFDDGDILFGCGHFKAEDADTGTQMMFLGSGVTAANEAARMRIVGDCTPYGGVAKSTLDGEGVITTGLAYSVTDFLTFQSFEVTGVTNAIATTCDPASDPDAPKFIDIDIYGITNDGLTFAGVNYLVQNVNIKSPGEPFFACNGNGSAAYGTLEHATLEQTNPTDADADGFQVQEGGAGFTGIDITVIKWGAFKGCGIASSVSGQIKIDGLHCTCMGPTADVSGMAIDGSGAGGYLRHSSFKNCGGAAVLLRADVTPLAGAFDVAANVWMNTRQGVAMSGAHPAGALTIRNNSGWVTAEALYATASYNPLSTVLRNNALDGPIGLSVDAAVAAADFDIDFTRYGPSVSSWLWRGTTDTTFAEYQATSTKDASSAHGAMGWAGGASPTTLQGFRLDEESALKCAGTRAAGRVTDLFGRGMEPHCHPVGATVYGRGDARATPLTARP